MASTTTTTAPTTSEVAAAATPPPPPPIEKFCIEYMVNLRCTRNDCPFKHIHRDHVACAEVHRADGYVKGRLTFVPVCRFHVQGKCLFGDQCRFRHEANMFPPQANNGNSSGGGGGGGGNMVSTWGRDKTCGICFDTVMEKTDGDRRFGILPNCTHCYCLACIYTWRQSHQFDHNVIKACPECRVPSDFIYPSAIWLENRTEKQCLIEAYKTHLRTRDCKYFNNGVGQCPFGNKCFYKHAYPDGRLCDVGPPRRHHHHHSHHRPHQNRNRHRHFHLTRSAFRLLGDIMLWPPIYDLDSGSLMDDEVDDDDDDDPFDDMSELADEFDLMNRDTESSDDSDFSDSLRLFDR